MTSFDICFRLRKVLGTRKIGHTGTLDPNATGLMIVLSDKDTKANQFLVSDSKEYIAECLIGCSTDTLDIDGSIIEEKEETMPDRNDIDNALKSFLGDSMQLPPMTSAIKVDGKKLYEYQREGKTVELEPRPVNVSEIELLNVNERTFSFRCKVSSGTYIRVLLQDILKKLNSDEYYRLRGYISKLSDTAADITYMIPEAKCPECDTKIEANKEVDASTLLFTRHHLGAFASM